MSIEEIRRIHYTNVGRREGIEQGIEQGREVIVAIVLKLLTKKIGTLPSDIEDKINKLNKEQLEKITDNILDYTTIDDIRKYLE